MQWNKIKIKKKTKYELYDKNQTDVQLFFKKITLLSKKISKLYSSMLTIGFISINYYVYWFIESFISWFLFSYEWILKWIMKSIHFNFFEYKRHDSFHIVHFLSCDFDCAIVHNAYHVKEEHHMEFCCTKQFTKKCFIIMPKVISR